MAGAIAAFLFYVTSSSYCHITALPHYRIILARRSIAVTYIYMQQYPFLAVCAVAALIPLIIGFIWYSKAVFGSSWMRANRFLDEDMKTSGGKMALTFILTYVFSFMLTIALSSIVIHQLPMAGVVGGSPKPGTPEGDWFANSMRLYGNNFRTFKHGALHGSITSIFLVLPVIGIIALFERRSWKYVLIHVGYWLVTLALMGGVLCQFIKLPGAA
jgi:hypothetical protein